MDQEERQQPQYVTSPFAAIRHLDNARSEHFVKADGMLTDAKIRRERIQGKSEANQTHCEVRRKVRQTIKDLGGTMPEGLPTPEKSIQQLRQEEQFRLRHRNLFALFEGLPDESL